MYQEILINVEAQEKRVAIIEDKRLEEFYVERPGSGKLVGNIYKGKVQAIVPAIGAAFVNIGLEKNGFLYVQDLIQPDYEKIAEIIDKPYVSERSANEGDNRRPGAQIKEMLKVGQEVVVQVTKEPVGTKGARLTTQISLPGRFLVLLPCDTHLGVSRKIQDNKERQRLRRLLEEVGSRHRMGLIVRTVAFGCSKKEFLQDLRYLLNLWRRIKALSVRRQAPCLSYEEFDLVLRTIRDKFTTQANRLLVDSKQEYKRVMRFLNVFSARLKSKVQFYRQDQPLFERKGVEEQISKIYERKVFLKSGGHMMIEPTEGLVAIDVNSGRFTKKVNPEETAYLINLQAAQEIARQIRLRDIGGIIIIDFIDMKSSSHKRRLFQVFNEALRRDYAKTDISPISELGLIEMTRQRTRKSLESVTYRACPYCQGKGLVKSQATIAILVLRELRKQLQKIKRKTLLVFIHPDVASRLANEHRQAIYNLENKFRTKIFIKQDASLHLERFRIELA
jgi:ribonuclease G